MTLWPLLFVAVGVLAALVALGAVMAMSQRNCGRCGTSRRHVRKPATARQALFGGWTCGTCGAELDRRGSVRSPD